MKQKCVPFFLLIQRNQGSDEKNKWMGKKGSEAAKSLLQFILKRLIPVQIKYADSRPIG